ncbi:MAG: HTH-type transcriptional regulator McbR [Candidatus Dichloromethanomonas elyunquensis]|nr:MAG: HTH-type transcriptional regulator McbR [Candidatus Dichloromethanomonas elyunquensis]
MEHLSLKESAYKIIKEKLLNLEFEPGSRVREDLLAQEISMSRTPVREAVNQLSAEGFLNNIPRKGIFVMQLTTKEISDFLDIREALETLAIENCIRKINEEQLALLGSILADFEEALSKDNFKKCNQLDSKFHLEIAKVSNNKKLIEFLGEIEDFMHIARAIEKKLQPKAKNELTLKEHKAILKAVRNMDVEKARKAIRANIKTMKENLGIY